MSDHLDDVFLHVNQFLRHEFPGEVLDELRLKLRSGRKLRYSAPAVPPQPKPASPLPRHSKDFRTVEWYGGRLFDFSPTQAPIVEMLWQAMESGVPDVAQAALLEEVESKSSQLRDLFRLNDAWGNLIVPGKQRGTYRIADPPAGELDK